MLSGGIPPKHFDDLDFVSTRRGRRVAAPAPTGDPWGYYAEHGRPHHTGTTRASSEVFTHPQTESSTKAMDTDEGQQTTA